MNKLLSVLVLLLVVNLCAAQTSAPKEAKDVPENIVPQKKLVIDIKNYQLQTVESMKDEFAGWKEKVKSVEINEQTHEFVMIHYSTLDNRELFDVLTKYKIEKNAIISYNAN